VRHTLRSEDCGSKSHEAGVPVIKPMAVGLEATAHVRAEKGGWIAFLVDKYLEVVKRKTKFG
jgi:hypothetical protein